MEIKYSILTCAYANDYQFSNFLLTACRQDILLPYEIVVVDNCTPNNGIHRVVDNAKKSIPGGNIGYYFIPECDKECTNITQGINLAADMAKGDYIVIIADSNVLLSYNLLSEIDKIIDDWKVVISGKGTDIKISPNGTIKKEYEKCDPMDAAVWCNDVLIEMGWPADPIQLKLIEGKYRYPPPHNEFDIYIVAMNRQLFLDSPYPVDKKSWGDYHSNWVKAKCREYNYERLTDVRIIHQYHRVWKDEQASC